MGATHCEYGAYTRHGAWLVSHSQRTFDGWIEGGQEPVMLESSNRLDQNVQTKCVWTTEPVPTDRKCRPIRDPAFTQGPNRDGRIGTDAFSPMPQCTSGSASRPWRHSAG